jgi:hypothetical protein
MANRRVSFLIAGMLAAAVLLGWVVTLLFTRPAATPSLAVATPAASAPTARAAPSPGAAPTAAASPAATAAPPTAVPATTIPTAPAPATPAAAAVSQRLGELVAQLRSGELEAVMVYDSGDRSTARVIFDLGDGQNAPGLSMHTVYTSSEETRTTDRIEIRGEAWERQDDRPWATAHAHGHIRGQLQSFLPDPAYMREIATPDAATISWYDPSRESAMTLILDPASGLPRELRQQPRGGGPRLTIIYRGWNTPVTIMPPSQRGRHVCAHSA